MQLKSAVLLVSLVLALGAPIAAAAQSDSYPDEADAAQQPDVTATPEPQIQVDGVQTSADDARLPGEDEEFIVNDGFGD